MIRRRNWRRADLCQCIPNRSIPVIQVKCENLPSIDDKGDHTPRN